MPNPNFSDPVTATLAAAVLVLGGVQVTDVVTADAQKDKIVTKHEHIQDSVFAEKLKHAVRPARMSETVTPTQYRHDSLGRVVDSVAPVHNFITASTTLPEKTAAGDVFIQTVERIRGGDTIPVFRQEYTPDAGRTVNPKLYFPNL